MAVSAVMRRNGANNNKVIVTHGLVCATSVALNDSDKRLREKGPEWNSAKLQFHTIGA
jgi:hypothetical protein